MAASGLVDTILRQARRRHLANLALEQTALSVTAGAAGAILLLLVGTQLLDWYWPVVLAVAGLAFGIYRSRRHLLNDYALARTVDSRLSLEDRLSTLHYFRRVANETPDGLATVEQQAESRLHPGDAERAMPLVMPRAAWSALALVIMCGGMLGLRYGMLNSLDLSRPLAHIEFNPFNEPPNVQASTKKSVIQERLEEQLKQLGLSVDDLQANDRELQPQQENISAVPSPEGEPAPGEKGGQSTGEKGPANEGEESDPSDQQGEKSDGKPESQQGNEAGDGQQSKQQPPPNAPKNQKSGEQNGLMDKMKDALANLMNKLKTPSRDQQQTQQASNQNMQQQGSQQTPGQQGSQTPSRSDQGSQSKPDQQGDREGEGDKLAANQSRAGDKSSDRPGGDESKTGMGKQDGDKAIKDAEQLAAMGKISEIFGKRAQQITGEMTIEVPSGKQQLKTAYTDRQATHTGASGEVNRDEIPLEYQPYIQRYFEEVRKTPAKAKAPASAPQPPPQQVVPAPQPLTPPSPASAR